MGNLFGAKAPKAPAVQPPTPLPDEEDPRIVLARRRKIAEERKTSGSMSTILSGGGRETLGGG